MDNHTAAPLAGGPAAEGHEPFRSLLPEFAMACLRGVAGGEAWAALEAHLDGCESCCEELRDLLDLLDAAAAGDLPAVVAAPPPSPELERPSGPVTVVELAAASARRILVEFTEAIRELVRQPALGGAFRSGDGPGGGGGEEFRYELPGGADDTTVAIDLVPSGEGRSLYDVKVTVFAPDRDPYSQDGHSVTLRYEAHEAEAETDSSGCALFHGVPYEAIPHLQLTVRPRPPEA